MDRFPTGTLTLLFTDIEGSTALVRQLGAGWPPVLERHRALLRAAVAEHDGVVVDSQGDALFAVFRSSLAAVAAARQGQHAMADEVWPEGIRLRVRMGLNTGEPIRADGGYAGIDVVRAARLCEAAHGGQTLLSESTRLVSGVDATDLGRITLRGIEAGERAFQLDVPGLPSSFPPPRAEPPAGESSSSDRIDRASKRLSQTIEDSVAARLESVAQLIERPRDR